MMPPELSCGLSLLAMAFLGTRLRRIATAINRAGGYCRIGGGLDWRVPLKFLSSALIFLAVDGLSPVQAQTISLKAQLNNPGLTIPSNFIGFSTKYSMLSTEYTRPKTPHSSHCSSCLAQAA